MDALGSYKGDVFSTSMGIDDMNSDLDATNIYEKMVSSEDDFFDIITEYNTDVASGKINRVDDFLEIYGDGDKNAGLEYIKKDLTVVDIGSHYIGRDEDTSIGDFIWENIQDAFILSSIKESQIVFQGEDAFNNSLDSTKNNQVFDKKPAIEKTAEKFIKYLEEGMSK